MQREPNASSERLKKQLLRVAEDSYGAERAAELEDQIEHTARMMAGVAAQDLDLTVHPLSGPQRRGEVQR
jgi:hypothetical protein